MATMKEIAGHFNVSIQTMTEYVKRHLDEINTDGPHAAMHGGKWMFDTVAIERMEELRGWRVSSVMKEVENKKLVQAQAIIQDLQNRLTQEALENKAAQEEKAATWQKMADLTASMALDKAELAKLRERTKTQEQAIQEKDQELQRRQDTMVSQAKKLQEQEMAVALKEKDLESQRQKLQRLKEETAKLKEHQDRISHATFWQRLTGKW